MKKRAAFFLLLAVVSAFILIVLKLLSVRPPVPHGHGHGHAQERVIEYERQMLTGFTRPIDHDGDGSGYDAARALVRRREILDFVCDAYSDLIVPEFASVVSSSVGLEPSREFLLSRNLTYCVPELPAARAVLPVLARVVGEAAEGTEDTMDPCTVKRLRSAKRNEESGVNDNGEKIWLPPRGRGRGAASGGDKQFKCDDEAQIGRLRHRLLVVQHPMEKLVSFFGAATAKDAGEAGGEMRRQLESALGGDAPTFANLARRLSGARRDFLRGAPALRPFWRECRVCGGQARPTAVVKLEHARSDLGAAMRAAGLLQGAAADAGAAARVLAPLSEVEAAALPTPAAERLFVELTRMEVLDLFDLYRADHELFGYDATPYVKLAAK